ncbi:hypothetical protein [Streptomyces solincola]|uniref:hypothetical protein n=1 Tax=Streptomyces solincola TaxID=2100817 RepID=UPI00269A1C11
MVHAPERTGTAPAPPEVPAARSEWEAALAKLRAAAVTEPGRLRALGGVLAVLLLAFGAVTALEVSSRAEAADDVVHRSQPLSADAADIYRSLADADTAAAGGFLAGPEEPAQVRTRYEKDIATASRLLVRAAAASGGSARSSDDIALLNESLPRYTGLVERARAANRQGLPLGGAYLRYANQQMSTTLLPAAERLYEAESGRLGQDEGSARAWPLVSLAVGVVALAALLWTQRRLFLRTNRVVNRGLLAATAAALVLLLGLVAGHAYARSMLTEARERGQDSLTALNDARINSLKARANENLAVVSRGAVLTADGRSDRYETEYGAGMARLGAALTEARGLADDGKGGAPVAEAQTKVAEWQERHKEARATDDAGDYDGTLAKVIGPEESTGESFDEVDAALERARDHEQGEFTRAAESAGAPLAWLPGAAAGLVLVAAAGTVAGVNRRLSEYR